MLLNGAYKMASMDCIIAIVVFQIYNAARRIVIGEYQSIVFSEFFSILIGTQALLPTRRNARTTYDPFVDPSVANEVSSASFRYLAFTVTSHGFTRP